MTHTESAPSVHRVLVVDDHPAIHDDFRKVLAGETMDAAAHLAAQIFGDTPRPADGERYEIDAVMQGEEAREKVIGALAERRPYTVAFVDMRMPPGWNGVQTVAHLRAIDPALQFVICTAHSDYSWGEIREALGPTDNVVILKKPFDKVEVLQLAHALSRKWMLAREVDFQIASLVRGGKPNARIAGDESAVAGGNRGALAGGNGAAAFAKDGGHRPARGGHRA